MTLADELREIARALHNHSWRLDENGCNCDWGWYKISPLERLEK